jgi:hypothetical protein
MRISPVYVDYRNAARPVFPILGLSALIHHRRVQLALSIRVTTAALVGSYACTILATCLAVVGGTDGRHRDANERPKALKTTFDYLVGTLGGAIYDGAIGLLIPHSNEIALLAVLAIAVAPLALLAAINPRLSVAPITAIIVLLVHPRKSDRFGVVVQFEIPPLA